MAELSSDDRERLREMIEDEWSATALERNWDATMALCTDDFAYLPPDSPVLHGKEQAKAFLEAFPTIVALAQTVESIVGSTELAVCRISFQLTIEQDGQTLSANGKGLGTMAKDNGSWLITQACFNLDAPPGDAS